MNYRQDVLRTAKFEVYTENEEIMMAAMGLAGETGEVVDLLKKMLFHGHAMSTEQLKRELGDVRWYLEYLAYLFDLTMEEIEQANIAKLKIRYPNGFNFKDAQDKEDEDKPI